MMQKIFSIIFLSMFFLFCRNTEGKTISVGKNKSVQSIQKALAIAQNGDTVLVYAGLYKEGNIFIKKSIVLKGINFPVLDGENKYEITVSYTHLTLPTILRV